MNLSLTTPATPRSESLAFLSLSANDFDCLEQGVKTPETPRVIGHCETSITTVPSLSQNDKARVALCDLIKTLTESKSADEFLGRRDRLFPQYADLMLGLGRILHALTDRTELNRRVKEKIESAEKFISDASEQFCPRYLKDQALFSLWEVSKTVDLAEFIYSRLPLPESKREEDLRLSTTCTMELLVGRIHLDCLIYAISARLVQPEDIRGVLSDGMRHFVNGHIAIRLGARLRQEYVNEEPVTLAPLDEEDRLLLLHDRDMAYRDEDQEY
jgi:hypothetical protein